MGVYINGIEMPKEPDEMIELAIFGDGKTLKTGESWRSPENGKCYYGPSEDMNTYYTEELSKPRWIHVAEQLPETFKHVLVNIPGMTPHPTVQEAFLEKNGMWYSNGFRYSVEEITHWMPLPEPPEEET